LVAPASFGGWDTDETCGGCGGASGRQSEFGADDGFDVFDADEDVFGFEVWHDVDVRHEYG
jgi:hypothetical protein